MGLITDWQIRFLKISLHGILFQKMGKQIVFSHVQILARSAYRIPTLRLRGLDPKAEYKNVETGEVFGGDELMYAGITIPRVRQDFSATMIIFEKM